MAVERIGEYGGGALIKVEGDAETGRVWPALDRCVRMCGGEVELV